MKIIFKKWHVSDLIASKIIELSHVNISPQARLGKISGKLQHSFIFYVKNKTISDFGLYILASL